MMDAASSINIIQALASGIDPFTGEEYPPDSPYQHPHTVRALSEAISALEVVKKSADKRKSLPINAGKAWETEEDRRLILAFDAGKTTKQLAEEHERTEGSICSRLVKHGRLQLQLGAG